MLAGHPEHSAIHAEPGRLANVFEDKRDGFTVRLSVTLPVTCAPDVVDQHLEHFAVEFRTWILRAAESGEA